MNLKLYLKVVLPVVLLLLVVGSVNAQDDQPDLQIVDPLTTLPVPDTSIEPPQTATTVEQGQTITVIAQVFNSNAAPVIDADTVEIRFRVVDGNFAPIELPEGAILCTRSPSATDPDRCALPASSFASTGTRVEVRATIDTSSVPVSDGLSVIADVDPENDVQESSDDNNQAQGTFNVTEVLPNLLIPADFLLSPANPRQGDLLSLQFSLVNDRSVDILSPFNIEIRIRRAISENLYESFIALSAPAVSCPGCNDATIQRATERTITAQIPTILLQPGDYQLQIQADSDDVLIENSEMDNTLTIDFTLQQPFRNLVLSGGRPNPLFAQQGDIVSFNFDVTNNSNVAAENVGMSFFIDGLPEVDPVVELPEIEQPAFTCSPATLFVNINGNSNGARATCGTLLSIGPNQTVSINAQFDTTDLPFGDYDVLVNLDPNGAFDETDETDNSLALFLTIGEDPFPSAPARGPELHPVSIELVPDSPVTQGDSILVTTKIKNSGNQNAEVFDVRFSIRREDGDQTGSFVAFQTTTVNVLKLGIDMDVKATLQTADLEPGLYSIQVDLLSPNQTELDENNNSIRAQFSVEAASE